MPKGELILVYPGIGQTKPLGFVEIISPEIELEEESIVGIKNIEIKNVRIIRIKINRIKFF